jgi:hypothetical protein
MKLYKQKEKQTKIEEKEQIQKQTKIEETKKKDGTTTIFCFRSVLRKPLPTIFLFFYFLF